MARNTSMCIISVNQASQHTEQDNSTEVALVKMYNDMLCMVDDR